MSKKPMQRNNYGHQRRNQRYSQGGGGGGGSHSHHNRPRRNYSASREKYLSQARDALASGDRVMAEYFYQHADHCYRMMMEENGGRPQRPQHTDQPGEEQQPTEEVAQEAPDMGNNSQLPAFITSSYDQQQGPKPVDPTTVQNWEERDA